jgi:ribosomal protein L40E
VIILSRNGTAQDRYTEHALRGDWWKVDKTGKSNSQVLKELGNRLICKKCEAVIARNGSRNRGKCHHCGWEGETITLDEMLTQQHYRR